MIIDTEEKLLEHFGKPMPVPELKLPPDYMWVTGVNGLEVAYAPPQELKIIRVKNDRI